MGLLTRGSVVLGEQGELRGSSILGRGRQFLLGGRRVFEAGLPSLSRAGGSALGLGLDLACLSLGASELCTQVLLDSEDASGELDEELVDLALHLGILLVVIGGKLDLAGSLLNLPHDLLELEFRRGSVGIVGILDLLRLKRFLSS